MTNIERPIWLPPPPAAPARSARTSHRGAMVAVLGAGVAAGAAAAITLGAGAATDNGAGSASSGNGLAAAQHGPGMLRMSGTATAVDTGKSTVTIKTASGTATYAVDSHSDIDKSGEASLAALKSGDAVTFSTVTTNGKATIAILHAGDESKNRPAGGFAGRAPGGWGPAGVPAPEGAPDGAAPNG